jgi:hypothetical protein
MKIKKAVVEVYNLIDIDNNRNVILTGTVNDIRTWVKNCWRDRRDMVELFDIHVEEDWYYFVDGDLTLVVISNMGYEMVEVCEVPIEDFE